MKKMELPELDFVPFFAGDVIVTSCDEYCMGYDYNEEICDDLMCDGDCPEYDCGLDECEPLCEPLCDLL